MDIDQKILDSFYHKIVPQASSSSGVIIDGFLFNAFFILDSQLHDYEDYSSPVIQIRNEEKFNQSLISYTKAMIHFLNMHPEFENIDYVYFHGDIDKIIESAVLNVWFNATEEDFRNPIEFLEKRTAFLEDFTSMREFSKHHITKTIDGKYPCHFEYYVDVWNPSGNETPYVFRSRICGEDGASIELPNIGFGIDHKDCYVYCLHNGKKKENLNSSEKKLNRIMYQANKNVDFDYDEERIQDISVSSLYALTLFTSFAQENGCTSLIVKGNFPVRNIAKMHNKKVDFDEFQRICNSAMNRYYRSFRRLSYHFPEFEILSYPYEIDNSMHIKIDNVVNSKDDFIHQVYDSSKSDSCTIKK